MKEYLLKPITETAAQARQAKGQKEKIAKQILLGIDAHLNGYQVCRKIDAGGLQPVQSFGLEKLLLFGYKQLGLAEKGLRGLRSRAFGLCALPQAQGAGHRGDGLRAGVSGSRQQAQT
jgi:hypothetical protein